MTTPSSLPPPGSSPRISLVIPAHNEEKYLPRLLDSVDAARARYEASGGALEVVVADNVSTDATADVAAERGCRVVPAEIRCIGAVRNAGARTSRGEIVAFVDADARIHPQTFVAIDEVMRSERVVGGATGVTLERWSLGIALTYATMIPLVWLTGFDTGVVFCRRTDFEAVNGYDESRRVAEDVMFLLALWRLGRKRGQRLVRLRRAKALASVRKFDEFGDWHYFALFRHAGAFLLKRDKRAADEFADRYWYQPRR